MRSYTNKKGELVTVSQDHLDTALELKRQLQMESPSHRVNWRKHKKMMEIEGYNDSEASENYRMLIRNYETRVVEDSYDDEIEEESSTNLKSVKEAVGDLYYNKREVQLETQKLGKLKRDLTLYGVVANEIAESIKEEFSNIQLNKFNINIEESSENTRMVVCLTDWHIGALVEVKGNTFNFKVAQRRIRHFLLDCIKVALVNKVTQIDVVFMGDAIENVYMRKSQAYDAEFSFSQQTVKCAKLLTELLVGLSAFKVTYRGFAGNHDRVLGNDKDNNLNGDTAVAIINEIVKTFVEAQKITNIEFIECNYYDASIIDINGKNIKFIHGDLDKKNDKNKLKHYSFKDSVFYDVIVQGHFHHYECLEIDADRFEVFFGSLKGSDDYSEILKVGSSPSQGIIVVYENGEMDFKRIKLK